MSQRNNGLRSDASIIPSARESLVLSADHAPAENRLLAALPRKDRQQFLSGCEQVELVFGNILCEPGEAIRHVYFPTDSFIALVTPVDGHSSMEVAMIGSEGMYGIPLMLGVDVTTLHAVVQGSGTAWRMDDKRFHRELERSVALQQELHRYIYVLISQLAQTAACSRFHVVEKRLARWLLMIRDRAHSEVFHITHELLAQVLGVRRVGVTKAASSLQKKKLISYSRGNVTIHDICGLEAASCGCYRVDQETYNRILHC
ncbi:MAG: Crp/Fnr family transcriptional regulator [Gallionellaceae bacterium]|nr:Crp/Fnr family transcriptional regulator [Gallionellaceae bacterium]